MIEEETLLAALTGAQRRAVLHRDGPLLILAGPGSGKTRVVVHRIAWLLSQGVRASQIAALTFTNKAADELRGRVQLLAPGQNVWASTFHRFCARLLRQYAHFVGLGENFTIYDVGDSRSVLKRVMEESAQDHERFSPDRIAGAISWAKNQLMDPENYVPRSGNPLGHVVQKLYPLYQARLLASNAVDFDDLLMHSALLLRDNPEVRSALDSRYRYIMVDEYQDTNLAQYSIVRALSIDYPNLAVTGDPDQAIYGWRGASLRNILDFEHDFPQVAVVKLEANFRSTKRILRAADALIRCNQRRKAKELFTDNAEGAEVRLNMHPTQGDEAAMIAERIAHEIRKCRRRPRDFAVFYRMNALSRSLELALRERGVPYQMVRGVEFFARQEIKDALAFLHLINNPRDDASLLRIINVPPRGIGKSTIKTLAEYAAASGMSVLDAARQSGIVPGVSPRAATAVAKFVAMYDSLTPLAAGPVEETLGQVLSKSGYRDQYKDSDEQEDLERLANIEELLTAAKQFDDEHPDDGGLEGFLEQSSLASDTDDYAAEDDRVTLMTLHASKGLEFPVVFIVAVEQGILPHERSMNDQESLEEERRLLFVGMTRAKEELELTCAAYRSFRGANKRTIQSQFLMELPRQDMQVVSPPQPSAAQFVRMIEDGVFDAAEHPYEAPSVASELRRDPLGEAAETANEDDDALSFDFGPDTPSAKEPDAAETANAKVPAPSPPKLRTAAELAGQKATVARADPDEFQLGMVVRHPEYGLGKVTAMSGNGTRRAATVAFASGAGERRFMLAQSTLQPVKSS